MNELAIFKNGKKRPREIGSVPVYGGNGVLAYTSQSNFSRCISIGRVGAYCGNVFLSRDKCWISDNAIATIPQKGTDIDFLYYLLKNLELNKMRIGSGQPLLTQSILNLIEVDIPTKELQNKIGSILGDIDNKIETNVLINKNLEEQARALFKAWFEDYEPFGGEVPNEFTSMTLGRVAEIKTDSMSPSKNPNVKVEHYSIPAYDEKHFPVFETTDDIKSNKYIITDKSVIISKLNPDTKRIWRPMCLSEHPICSTEFIVYEARNPAHKDFLYSLIDSKPFFNHLCSHTTGSTNSRQRATPSTTLDFEFVLPSDEWIKKFCLIVTPMYDTISANLIENQTLAALRDTLLPRLMSGEIDVSSIEI